MKQRIIDWAFEKQQQMVTEILTHGEAKTAVTKIMSIVCMGMLEKNVINAVKEMDIQDKDLKFEVLLAGEDGAGMYYSPSEHTIYVPVVGVMVLVSEYLHPSVMKRIGIKYDAKDVIREFLAHEVGHAYDAELKRTAFFIKATSELLERRNAEGITPANVNDTLFQFNLLDKHLMDAERNAASIGLEFARNKELFRKLNDMNLKIYEFRHNNIRYQIKDEAIKGGINNG